MKKSYNFINNKKAQGMTWGTMAIVLVLSSILIGIVGVGYAMIAKDVVLTGNFIQLDTDVALNEYRFLNNPNCFAEQDHLTNRVKGGFIDFKKFTNIQLNTKCYPVKKKSERPCYKFTLINLKTGQTIAEAQTNNFMHCRATGAKTTRHTRLVQYEKNTIPQVGKLIVDRG